MPITIPGRYTKARCRACGRLTRSGVCNPLYPDPGDLRFRLICDPCFRTIMVEGRDPDPAAGN